MIRCSEQQTIEYARVTERADLKCTEVKAELKELRNQLMEHFKSIMSVPKKPISKKGENHAQV